MDSTGSELNMSTMIGICEIGDEPSDFIIAWILLSS
jgi:hypothetical protein